MPRLLPILATIGLAAFCSNCGYVGEPLPPALRRPVPVTDLVATERGSKIVIQFTIPTVTTEDLPIAPKPDLELRIGPVGASFQPENWAGTAERIADVPQQKGVARVELDAAKWAGKNVAVGVNVHGPGGRSAGWSNFVAVSVVPPLGKPEALELRDGPDSVVLAWRAAAPEFRIFRKTVSGTEWVRIATSAKPGFSDNSIEYGQTYEYYVQSQQKAGDGYAESEESEVRTIKPVDRFAPATPTGLAVVPGTRSMELVWDRNTEKDFASYRIYRNGVVLPETVVSPAFSDQNVTSGSKYEYRISAVDTAGNESPKSAPVTSEIP